MMMMTMMNKTCDVLETERRSWYVFCEGCNGNSVRKSLVWATTVTATPAINSTSL